MPTSVSVIGMGKVGAPTVAAMAARGIRAIGVDSDAAKVEPIERGMPPVFEPCLAETLIRAQGRLTATQSIEVSVRDSEHHFYRGCRSCGHGRHLFVALRTSCVRVGAKLESLYRTVCENRPPGGPHEPRQRGNRQTRGEHLRHYEDQLCEHTGPFV